MGQHSITVDEVLWSAATAKARTEDTTVDALVTAALMAYTGASEVMGIMVVPDPRMAAGLAGVCSAAGRPSFMHLGTPARPPWTDPWRSEP
jgi:hypothetical protein